MIISHKTLNRNLNPRHLDHPMGFCFYSEKLKLGYIFIPKNASKNMIAVLNDLGFVEGNYFDLIKQDPAYKFIVLLRDPMKRWISGILQYLIDVKLTHIIQNPQMLTLFTDGIVFDNHTELQVSYLEGIDTDHCYFFNIDDQLSVKINNLFKNYGVDFNLIDTGRNTNDMGKLKEYLSNNSIKERIIKLYYEPDYCLIDKIIFFV